MTDVDRVRFMEHQGRRIILLDFAGITDLDDGLAAVAEATAFIGAQPVGGDTMTLTDVTDTGPRVARGAGLNGRRFRVVAVS